MQSELSSLLEAILRWLGGPHLAAGVEDRSLVYELPHENLLSDRIPRGFPATASDVGVKRTGNVKQPQVLSVSRGTTDNRSLLAANFQLFAFDMETKCQLPSYLANNRLNPQWSTAR